MAVEPYHINGGKRIKELCVEILLERENRSELYGDSSAVTSSLRAALAGGVDHPKPVSKAGYRLYHRRRYGFLVLVTEPTAPHTMPS